MTITVVQEDGLVATGPGPIFLLTGPPGAGKSSVARALLHRFRLGVHIPVDDLRALVVSGIAHPVPAWTTETTRQFQLARQAACQLARLYADAGFGVVLDDVIFARDVDEIFAGLAASHVFHRILLLPAVEVALERNRTRTNKSFDTAVLEETIGGIHRALGSQALATDEWLVVDSSRSSVDETVDEVLAKTATR